MIIVKITVLSLVITNILILATNVWVSTHHTKTKCPMRIYGLKLFVFLDIIGILASVVYLLFFR